MTATAAKTRFEEYQDNLESLVSESDQVTLLSQALDNKAQELYSKSEWDARKKIYEDRGIDTVYYDMQCETFNAVYSEQPELFEDYDWINTEDGFPLWVKPGVDWIPEHEIEFDE
jgi:hypothetical protein